MCTCSNILIDVQINQDNKSHWTNEMTQHILLQVRILRPGNPIPADVRPFVNKHPEMTSKVCALIEFERTEFAMKAVRQLNEEQEEKMKVKKKFFKNLLFGVSFGY